MVEQIADFTIDYPKIIVKFNDYFLNTNDNEWENNFNIFIEKYIDFNRPEKNYSIIIYSSWIAKINLNQVYFFIKKAIGLIKKLTVLKKKNKYFCENTIIITNNNTLITLFFNIIFSITSPLSNIYLVDNYFIANKLFNKIYKKEYICEGDYSFLYKRKF